MGPGGKTLHITNGDSAADLIRAAGLAGDILPWRDVLHDGPVPMGLDLASLSRVRADFIADLGWAPRDRVQREFADRDQAVIGWSGYERIRLWFEHDLYDQLQVLQVLDHFASRDVGNGRLTMICTENHPGQQTAEQLAGLQAFEQPVSQQQLALASDAWQAFRTPDPRQWHALLGRDTSPLPYLEGSVRRLLLEYPSVHSGLGLTEERVLDLLLDGPMPWDRMFVENRRLEQRVFMGDWSYRELLRQMMDADPALIRTTDGSRKSGPGVTLALTGAGHAVQQGADADLHRPLHWSLRWFGGVCMTRSDHWRRQADGEPVHWRDECRATPQSVNIRRFRDGDTVGLRHCAQAAYSRYIARIGKPPMPMLDDYSDLAERAEVHVAVDGADNPVGFLVLAPESGRMLLENVAVHPDAQGQRIGSRLMGLAESRAAALGYPTIELYTHSAMKENRAIYQHLGYHEVRQVVEQGYHRVYMRKQLS